MSLLKDVFFRASNLFPLSVLMSASRKKAIFPYQHTVSNEALPHIQNLYRYKNVKQFEKDVDWLLRHFEIMDAATVHRSILSGIPLSRNSFLLTFDDGFREVYDVIAPLLTRKGVPAIFFVNPAFIDNKELFYRCKLSLLLEAIKQDALARKQIAKALGIQVSDFNSIKIELLKIQYPSRERADALAEVVGLDYQSFLEKQKPFLTSTQLQQLAAKGFTIGAHSVDHPNFKFLSLPEQLSQTERSIAFAKQFSASAHFAFPHEDKPVARSFFDEWKGQDIAFWGTQNLRDERALSLIHRFNIEDPARPIAPTLKGMLLRPILLPNSKPRR